MSVTQTSSSLNVELNARDQRLLTYLFENKVASVEQISRDIFNNGHISTARRRLHKLWKVGKIEKIAHHSECRLRILYSLSPNGLRYLRSGKANDGTIGQRKSDSVEHDLELLDIRNRLTQAIETRTYLTENTLQSDKQYHLDPLIRHAVEMRSDAVLEHVRSEKRSWLPLEYEATAKSELRYLDKLKGYYARPKIGGILFIAENRQLLDIVSTLDQSLRDKYYLKMYFATKDQVFSAHKELIFRSNNGKNLKFAFESESDQLTCLQTAS